MAKRSSDPRVAYPEVKVQVRDLVRVVDVAAPFAPRGANIQGKFVLSRNPGIQDEGDRHVAKRSSDPREAYPEVKVQVRDLVRVVGIVVLFAPRGVSIRGKFVLSRPGCK